MKWIRTAVRVTLLAAWTFPLFLALLGSHMVGWAIPGVRWRSRRAIVRLWARVACRIVGARVERSGEPPERPFIVVTNHYTWLDIFVLLRELACIFIARGDMARWPVLGLLARHANVIFINRADVRDAARVNQRIAKALETEGGVHIFAEGGIPPDGAFAGFRPPLLQTAVDQNMAVHCAVLKYRAPEKAPAVEEAVFWGPGKSLVRSAIDIMGLPWVAATVRYAPEPQTSGDRKQLAEKLTKTAERLLQESSEP